MANAGQGVIELSIDVIFAEWLDSECEDKAAIASMTTYSNAEHLSSVVLSHSSPSLPANDQYKTFKRHNLNDWPSTKQILEALNFNIEHDNPFERMGINTCAGGTLPNEDRIDHRFRIFELFVGPSKIRKWDSAAD